MSGDRRVTAAAASVARAVRSAATPSPYDALMTARQAPYRCTACQADALRWAGQCSTCGAWNSLEEVVAEQETAVVLTPQALGAIDRGATTPVPTGVTEVDRVLAGGLVPGSVTLVAGAPGIGKSTLCLQAAVVAAARGEVALIVAAEESAPQVAGRAARLGAPATGIEVLATASLPDALAAMLTTAASVVVVDSISTMADPMIKSPSGGVAQVRAAAERLAHIAHARGIALILVGHVTKEGDLAGPRALEHLVDTVMHIEGDRHHERRVVSTTKHRFGPAGEVGLLTMDADGFRSVADPSAALMAERGPALPGSVATVLAEGARPLVVEIQALVTPAVASPARVAQSVSATRLRQLAAVLDAHGGLDLGRHDLFVACSGAVRATEPAVDLAVVAALVSAYQDVALDPRVLCLGEVGLTGAIRPPSSGGRRLAEAARVGLDWAVVPPGVEIPPGVRAIEVTTVRDLLGAIERLSIRRRTPAPDRSSQPF